MKPHFIISFLVFSFVASNIRAVVPEPEPDAPEPWQLEIPVDPDTDPGGSGTPVDLAGAGAFAAAITPEIQSLADGLAAGEGGPTNVAGAKRIYDYVQNHVEYSHYFGCKKGAQLTLLEKSGGDFDQCALLVALMRAAGYTANYQFGLVSIPYTNAATGKDIQHWLRLTLPGDNLTTVTNYLTALLSVRDYPGLDPTYASFRPMFVLGANLNCAWPRTWVVLTLNGTNYYLDPAFKVSQRITGIDLAAIAGVTKSNLLSVTGGTTNGVDSVFGLSETNLANTLTRYTTNFLNFLQTNGSALTPLDVIGGWTISPTTTTELPTALQFPIVTSVLGAPFPVLTWTNIPDVYLYTLRIATATGIDRTYSFAELAGSRLSVILPAINQPAQLWLDDALVVSETNAAPNPLPITLYLRSLKDAHWNFDNKVIDRPDSYGITSSSKTYKRTTSAYALVYGFEPNGDLLRQRQEKLAQYRQLGSNDTSRVVLTETLNVIGQSWLFQTTLLQRMAAAQQGQLFQYKGRIGRVAQESAYYVDFSLQKDSTYPNSGNTSTDQQAWKDYFDVTSYFDSAMEHGVLEQMQDAYAVSTVKVLSFANQTNKLFRVTSTNWSSIRTQLTGYAIGSVLTSGTQLYFSNRVYNGSILLLPSRWPITVGIWSGAAYVERTDQGTNYTIGMFIDGLSGGYNSFYGSVSSYPLLYQYNSSPTFYNPAPITVPTLHGADPVNMADGSFTVDATDLALGQTEPRGLALSRHYSSAQRNFNSAGLGYGWTHNYRIYASDQPDVRAGLGLATPEEMAAIAVATRAALTVYAGSTSAKEWAVTALIAKWGVDQLRTNAVSVVLGKDAVQFTRQPDGTFTPSAGLKMALTRSNNLYVLEERHGRTFSFDSSNRVTSIKDPFGKTSSFTYTNTTGNLIQVKDAYNRTLTFNYAASNKLSSVADSTGRTMALTLDGNLNLIGVSDPENKTSTFAYDTNHQILATSNALNQLVTTNFYDSLGHVTNQWTQGDPNKSWRLYYSGFANVEQDPAGGRRWFFFDDLHRATGMRDALGNTNLVFYDGQDHVIKTVSPLNETNTFVYDGNQNLLWSLDALGIGQTNYYDNLFHLTSTVDALGHSTQFGYNAQHALTGVTNGTGDWVAFGYSSGGDLTNRTDGGGSTGYSYDGNGLLSVVGFPGGLGSEGLLNNARGDVLSHTNARGFVTSFEYNQRRERTNTIAPTNLTAKVAYDAVGNVQFATDARGFITSNTWSATRKLLSTTVSVPGVGMTNVYDARDWLIRTLHPLQVTINYTNDAAARLMAVTDPVSRPTKFSYDADGRKMGITNAASEVTKQQWNARGELTNLVTAANTTIARTYDPAGNQIFLTNRNGKTWRFYFDAANRLTNTITPKGSETRITYDSRGLVNTVREPSTQTATNFYDAKGRLTNITDAVGVRWFAYDANDNLTSVTNVGQASRLSQSFDAYDRMLAHTNAEGYVIQYRYDATGNLTNLIYPGNRTVIYAYDSLNRLTNVTDWDNRKTSFEYDLASRLTKISRPNGSVREINYDAAGQTTNIVERLANNAPIAFFKFHWNDAARMDWKFAAPLPHSNTPPSRTMTFDLDNHITYVNGLSVAHDDDGNMTSGPLTNDTFATYNYDARNRLTNIAGISYGYDPAGNRVAITNGASVTRFVINPNAALSQVLMRIKSGVTNYYVYGLGLLYEADDGGNTKTYHYDYRGSTVALTDGNGVPTDLIEYSPYGTTTYRVGATDTQFLYNGRYGVQTDVNGLVYMRARYYNPYLCRFLNADPSGFEGGLNFYAFADGNPVSMTDPYGLGAISSGGFSWIDYSANDRIHDEFMAGYNQMQSQMASAWYGSPAPMSGGQLFSSTLNITPFVGGFKMAGEAFFGSDFVTGQRIENEYSHAAWGVANLGASFMGVVEAGAAAKTVSPQMVTVSRWGRPGLQSGDWVMNGPANTWNYVRSFKWQPGGGNTFAPYGSGQEFSVPASSLQWPRGWGIDGAWKGVFGQRRYVPPPSATPPPGPGG